MKNIYLRMCTYIKCVKFYYLEKNLGTTEINQNNFFFICLLEDLAIAKSYAVPTSESGKVIYALD